MFYHAVFGVIRQLRVSGRGWPLSFGGFGKKCPCHHPRAGAAWRAGKTAVRHSGNARALRPCGRAYGVFETQPRAGVWHAGHTAGPGTARLCAPRHTAGAHRRVRRGRRGGPCKAFPPATIPQIAAGFVCAPHRAKPWPLQQTLAIFQTRCWPICTWQTWWRWRQITTCTC